MEGLIFGILRYINTIYGLVQEVSADEIDTKNKFCGLAAVKCLLQQLFSFVPQENFILFYTGHPVGYPIMQHQGK